MAEQQQWIDGVEPPADGMLARSPAEGAPRARLQRAERRQIRLLPTSLDALVPPEHPVRGIWEFVSRMDLSAFHAKVAAVEGHVGRPAIDPAILLALWVYGISQGVGSARMLASLCEDHVAYRWVCGGVSVTRTPLTEFRVEHGREIDELLTQMVGVLMHEGLVTLERTAQDGMKVRASAGAPSFRRRRTLQGCLEEARTRVAELRKRLDEDPGEPDRRQQAAQERAARERLERVEAALGQWEDVRRRKTLKKGEDPEEKVRVSTTDPDARVMKMPDGGFRPAFNLQLTADSKGQFVVGVDVSNSGGDNCRMTPMLDQLKRRYGKLPREHLVDGGFANRDAITKADRRGCTVYAPESKLRKGSKRTKGERRDDDTDEAAKWRERMQTEEAKGIYRERSGMIECVNGILRNRGLVKFVVRGLDRVKAVASLYAVAHNILRRLSIANDLPHRDMATT